MEKAELLNFLTRRTWNGEDRQTLVDEWNRLRGDSKVGQINIQSVRTPCRLKQVVGSFKEYLQNI
jgi:hypothetical protein